ncbi:unnamed protein product [Closterium sp. NIES-65]|nr:unnamed protein product [Closterium sp. NIES-65]
MQNSQKHLGVLALLVWPPAVLRQGGKPLSPQELRVWFARRLRRAAGAGAAGGVGAGVSTGAGASGGAAEAAGADGPTGVGAAGIGAAGGVGAGVSTGADGPTGVGAAGAGAARGVGAGGAAGAGASEGTGVGAVGAGGSAGAGAAGGGTGAVLVGSRGAARPRPYFVPLLEQVLGLPPSTGPAPPPRVSTACPVAVTITARPPLYPAPSPYTGPTTGLAERREPSVPRHLFVLLALVVVLRVRVLLRFPAHTRWHCVLPLLRCVSRCRLLQSPSLPSLADPESDSLRAASPSTSRLLDRTLRRSRVPTPLSGSRPWTQEMASWKSTGTYIDEVPPPGANIVSGMWNLQGEAAARLSACLQGALRGSRLQSAAGVDYFHTFSPTPKMTTLRMLLHIAAQRDYELHSLDFSTAFLQGSLHEEIWLRRPPGFTGCFLLAPSGASGGQSTVSAKAPREWHDILRTTLAALGFAPSTADPSLFLRTDTSLPPFYILVYVDDLVFAPADTTGLAHVKSELQKRHTCTDLGELRSYLGLQITRERAQSTITLTQSHMVQQVLQRFGFTYSSPQATPLPTRHSLSALPSDESVESSGPYPELVGCLMYLMTCTRPDLAYPLSILARYVATGRHRPEHMAAAKRVLCYMGQAAQELCWLTYLLIDLGEPPRSPPVLYVDNKAMLALCREHRLEHRMKHIALRYFLSRELQQRGQLRLTYVASEANTVDIFTKALSPCDHQRFCTVLGLVPTWPHLLTS